MTCNLWQALKAFNLFRLMANRKTNIISVNESLRRWGSKRNWIWKWNFRLERKFSLYFRKLSCFISKNILSKIVSILPCPSTVRPAYPKIHFRIMNPPSQLYINRKFQKYISVSICHCHRASFMRSLFIAFMNGDILSYVLALQLKLLC